MRKKEKKILKQAKELADFLNEEENKYVKKMNKKGDFSVPYGIAMGNTLAWHLYCNLKEFFGKKVEINIREICRQIIKGRKLK